VLIQNIILIDETALQLVSFFIVGFIWKETRIEVKDLEKIDVFESNKICKTESERKNKIILSELNQAYITSYYYSLIICKTKIWDFWTQLQYVAL